MSVRVIKAIVLIFIVKNATGQAVATQAVQSINYNGFLKNVGQIRDLKNLPAKSVLYYGQLNNRGIYITDKGLSFLFHRIKDKNNPQAEAKLKKAATADTLTHFELERVDFNLINASINENNIETKDAGISALYNFYFDAYSEKGSGIRLKNEILIRNVYKGIDWRIFLTQKGDSISFKYEFIVHPGAKAEDIKLRYSDNARVKLVDEGMHVQSHMGFIKEANPFVFTEDDKEPIQASFAKDKKNIHFAVAAYDRSKTLVIDPDVFWATYLSSTIKSQDPYHVQGTDVRVDSANNIYVQLFANDKTPFPTLNPGGGAYYQDFAAAPNGSMILMKFTPLGQLLWSTYFGAATEIRGSKMTTDKWGNLYATGWFRGNNAPIPLLDNGGFFDNDYFLKQVFITKFDDKGRLTWCSLFAGTSTYVRDMTADYAGNVYVVGHSASQGFPVVNPGNGAFCVTTPQHGAGYVFFISQFSVSNQLVWSTRIEGNAQDDLGTRVHADKLGNVYVIGGGRSNSYPLVDAGGYFSTVANGNDIMLSKFNANRQMIWSTRYPGSFNAQDITTDDAGDVYIVTGYMFAKFSTNTNLIWEKRIPTIRAHALTDIEFDAVNGQFQVLGHMNDKWWDFPAQNTVCGGSFFWDSQTSVYNDPIGPLFLTFNKDGDILYLSQADWPYEYWEYSQMTVDKKGDAIYLFDFMQSAQTSPNPDLTDPGNGAFFDPNSSRLSAFLLKLTWQGLQVDSVVTAPTDCTPNGSIQLTVTCGTAPFSYKWNTGATTASLTNIGQGDYSVTITDSKGLTKNLQFKLPPPPQGVKAFTSTITPENCNKANGSINVISVAGGQAPYTYAIDQSLFNSAALFANLDSGSYAIHVKDVNGCLFTDTVHVTRIKGPDRIDVTIVSSNCNQATGEINAKASGGASPYTYTLNALPSSTGNFLNLAPGDYLLTATDNAGCSFSKTVTVSASAPPTDAMIDLIDDHCASSMGQLQVQTVTGGNAPFSYAINAGSFSTTPVFSNLPAGNYTVYIKDNKNCVLQKGGVVIKNIEGPTSMLLTVDNAACGLLTGAVTVSSVTGGAGPYTYTVDNGSFTTRVAWKDLQPGAHELEVKDDFGCRYKESFIIRSIPGTQVSIYPKDTMVCYNSPVQFFVSAAPPALKDVVWSTGDAGVTTNVNATEDRIISLRATDDNGCIINESAVLKVKACSTPDKCVIIPGAFTPNKDGKNDRFGVSVNGCPVKDFTLALYNRNGEIVFKTDNLSAKWDGVYRNQPQSSGVYVYLCTYTGENNITYTKKGTFALIR